eukprot:TRINITY_DN4417_c0_g2_i1.p1 TRINITY_DN4417_c0_g2~~TRINITY_DN4417_c0_g2_i1.p1  ORF type:complete len:161 (-),score=9.33 TRINITY_DN4417_c0_g2_i1:88-570(-)
MPSIPQYTQSWACKDKRLGALIMSSSAPRVRYSPLSTHVADDLTRRSSQPSSNNEDTSTSVDVKSRRGPLADDRRFSYSPKEKIPWASILLGLFLLSLGCLFLIVFYLILVGHMPADFSQAASLLALGVLVILPGYYVTRIAYYSWRGRRGYSFRHIPAY